MTTNANDTSDDKLQKSMDNRGRQRNGNDQNSFVFTNTQHTTGDTSEPWNSRFREQQAELSRHRSKSVPLKMTMLENASKIRTKKFENLMS